MKEIPDKMCAHSVGYSRVQQDLRYLLGQRWKLVGVNLVESPDGMLRSTNIELMARAWRVKMQARQIIDRKKSSKYLRKHLTHQSFCHKLLTVH